MGRRERKLGLQGNRSLDKYDKDKFVVLVCAGPSARFVKKADEYYTAGVNVTPKLIEETDFWVVNDACYFSDIPEEKLLKMSYEMSKRFKEMRLNKAPAKEFRPPSCNLLCMKVDVSAIGVSETAFI